MSSLRSDHCFFFQMEKQTSTQDGSKIKRSRRQHRKPRNLREETIRRQRDHVWLETHLWHAKRMHMRDYYGYRVAETTNDKGIRQTYRSLRYGCLMTVSRPQQPMMVYLLCSINTGFHTEGASGIVPPQPQFPPSPQKFV